jgi:hypothetical protein
MFMHSWNVVTFNETFSGRTDEKFRARVAWWALNASPQHVSEEYATVQSFPSSDTVST